MFARNVGGADRAIRIVVGLALMAVGFLWLGGTTGIVVGVVGLVPILTALIGWCPLYSILGVRTCSQC